MVIMQDTPLPYIKALKASLAAAQQVEVVETHISWVLLTEDFAYKLKKPVTLPFLDYGTRALRRVCCDAELRLNRRFAPQLYLAVVDLAGEPAVKMRRFAEELRLDHVCKRGALKAEHLTTFARDLVAFQAAAAASTAASQSFGAPATVRAVALENFTELEQLLPAAAQLATLARLKAWTQAEYDRRTADFMRRQAAGRIREGHGDLHLGNLVLLDDRITPFDGIEFNETFRWIDVVSEVAFTLLDLLDHEQAGLASWLLNTWLSDSGDYDALSVLRFYLVSRAMVRAKGAALRADVAQADEYLAMAQRLAAPSTPSLTITCGVSGSGKTYVSARRLTSADFLDTVRIRSDVERMRPFGLAPEAASDGSIYSADATVHTYARLAELAGAALQSGWSVLVDAAFLKRAERDAFRALAQRMEVPFSILAPDSSASPTALARRIGLRQNDASEATVEIMEQQLRWLEPLGPDEPSKPV
jgi:aminoglycoside phosphotransferase family enzyme